MRSRNSLIWFVLALVLILLTKYCLGQSPARNAQGLFALPKEQAQVEQQQASTRLDVGWFNRVAEIEARIEVRPGMVLVVKYPKGSKVESIAAHLAQLQEELEKHLPRERK